MNSDNCNTCIWKKGNSCTQPCTGTIIKEKDQEIANAKLTIERDEALRTEYHQEIAELKAKLKRLQEFKKAVIRDRGECGAYEERDIKREESKETEGKE